MEVKELRIGNLVKYKTGEIMTITGVVIGGVFVKEKKATEGGKGLWTLAFIQFSPIQLTEEWLLKFGVSKWILGNTFEIRANESFGVSIYAWQSGVCMFICNLDYVHQFQNWYYLHSKFEELTLKP